METLARDGKIVIGMVGLPARGKVTTLLFLQVLTSLDLHF